LKQGLDKEKKGNSKGKKWVDEIGTWERIGERKCQVSERYGIGKMLG
jgi:hypothetical protein